MSFSSKYGNEPTLLNYVKNNTTSTNDGGGSTGPTGAAGPTGPTGPGNTLVFSLSKTLPSPGGTINNSNLTFIDWSQWASSITENNMGTSYDVWNISDPTNIVLPVTGRYRIQCMLYGYTNNWWMLYPRQNGIVNIVPAVSINSVGLGLSDINFNFTFDYYFSAGDTFSLLNFFAGSVSSLEAGIITITYLTY